MLRNTQLFSESLSHLDPSKKLLITTINAHSYNVALEDIEFKQALLKSDVLIPDGVSVVWAKKWLTGQKIEKIAGADLFFYELNRLKESGGKCFFLGSTDSTLDAITKRLSIEYPKIQVTTYSPPYKPVFSDEDNQIMIEQINNFEPDVLFVGMTAPKQEKWAYNNLSNLKVGHICCIGAVFDFYAGTVNRAPQFMINMGLEWLYRLVKEPKRLWKRYLIGNSKFIFAMVNEKFARAN